MGSEWRTRVRTVVSVALAGREERKRDICDPTPEHGDQLLAERYRSVSRTYDRRVFGRRQALVGRVLPHDLACYRVIPTVIPVLDVLF